jgi:hypothetical protein
VELNVVEEQIDPEVVATELERVLASDECEPAAELQQKSAQVLEERSVKLALAELLARAKQLEAVGILEELLREL